MLIMQMKGKHNTAILGKHSTAIKSLFEFCWMFICMKMWPFSVGEW